MSMSAMDQRYKDRGRKRVSHRQLNIDLPIKANNAPGHISVKSSPDFARELTL
jgi:hypothetical protein